MIMEKDVNCSNFRGLFGYLRKYHGDEGIQQVVEGLVDNDNYLLRDKDDPSKFKGIKKHQLDDSAYWVSNDFSLALFRNAKKTIGGSNNLIKAGEEAVVNYLSKSVLFASRIFSSKFIAKQAAKINSRFNKTKNVILSELTSNSANFELHYQPNFQVTKDICNWNLGIYTGIAKMTGAEKVSCEEVKCVLDGDDHCSFLVTWKKGPNVIKRIVRWILKTISKDLIVDYTATMDQRDRLIDTLTLSEERYRALTDQSLTGIFIHHDGTLIFVNDCFAQMLKYSPEEIVGKKFWDFVHPEDCDLVQEKEIFRSNGVYDSTNYEFRAIQKNGEVIWLETFATVIKTNGQKACMGNVIDLTSKKQAEEALKKSEERFRELAELLPETIFEMDKEGYLKYVNQSAFEHFKYSQQDFDESKNAFDMIVPEDRQRAMENAQKVLQGENVGLREYTALRKDDSTFPVMLNTSAIFHEGKPVGLRGVVIDISERKRLETQLQQAHKMEAVGTLAGGVAHDFNNLMMAMLGNISLILHETEPTHPHRERLKNVEDLVQSGSKLTNQLLGFARKGRYEVKLASLNKIVQESLETFGRTRKEIKIHRDLLENLYAIEADETQIQQVLLNLYINAADAMPGGGNLSIKTVNVTHTEMQGKAYDPKPGDYVMLKVTDNGTGMDKATMKCIFDPFFTTKEMGRGTGLGLASVYGIVKAHGGYIDVESKEGYGTSFIIYLPASEGSIHEIPEVSERIEEGTGTILLVDDEEMVLEVGVQMLKKIGYTVLQAKTGTEAVTIYEELKGEIDLVILDMIMPGLGGGETYDKMKEIDPNLKALLSSGYSIDGKATEILDRGCDGFIQKPFDMKDLSKKIKEILNE